MNCESLTEIYIPSSVISIDYDVFEDCENLVIHTPVGSVAEVYAKAKRIPVVAE